MSFSFLTAYGRQYKYKQVKLARCMPSRDEAPASERREEVSKLCVEPGQQRDEELLATG